MRAHLLARDTVDDSQESYTLDLGLGPQRRGFVRGSLAASVFCVLAQVIVFRARVSIHAAQSSSAPSLLLIVPGLLSAYLSRPGEHPVAARLYLAMRFLLGAAALGVWMTATAIALHVTARHLLVTSVAGMVFSLGVAGVALGAYLAAGRWPRRRPGRGGSP